MIITYRSSINYDARLYDPATGVFVSADSIVPDWFDPQSLNRYAYARNNPLVYTDPTGHFPAETALDVVSLADSAATMAMGPSWANAGWLVWDVVGLLPYVPGSWAGKTVKYGEKLLDEGHDAAKLVDKGSEFVGVADDIEKTSKSGAVVIGENMARVEGYASRIGAETFQGTGMEANRLWIQEARSAGKQVMDIGPDFARRGERVKAGIRPDSPFYNMERMETMGYENYLKVFERTGKYQGGVP